jgi:hypothetical protein
MIHTFHIGSMSACRLFRKAFEAKQLRLLLGFDPRFSLIEGLRSKSLLFAFSTHSESSAKLVQLLGMLS